MSASSFQEALQPATDTTPSQYNAKSQAAKNKNRNPCVLCKEARSKCELIRGPDCKRCRRCADKGRECIIATSTPAQSNGSSGFIMTTPGDYEKGPDTAIASSDCQDRPSSQPEGIGLDGPHNSPYTTTASNCADTAIGNKVGRPRECSWNTSVSSLNTQSDESPKTPHDAAPLYTFAPEHRDTQSSILETPEEKTSYYGDDSRPIYSEPESYIKPEVYMLADNHHQLIGASEVIAGDTCFPQDIFAFGKSPDEQGSIEYDPENARYHMDEKSDGPNDHQELFKKLRQRVDGMTESIEALVGLRTQDLYASQTNDFNAVVADGQQNPLPVPATIRDFQLSQGMQNYLMDHTSYNTGYSDQLCQLPAYPVPVDDRSGEMETTPTHMNSQRSYCIPIPTAIQCLDGGAPLTVAPCPNIAFKQYPYEEENMLT